MVGNRFQYSLRTLLLVPLALALPLVPVAWVSRERQQMVRARTAILEAREAALRSVVLEEQRRRGEIAARSGAARAEQPSSQGGNPAVEEESSVMQRLERENTSLRQQVNELRREVEQLRNSTKPLGTAGR